MKAIDYVLIAALALVVLVGCGQVQEAQLESAPSSGESAEAPSSVGEVADATQLALGTLKLDETDLAVTPAQAAELVPLWQASRNLARSGTGATEEVNAVLEQIQAAMTPEPVRWADGRCVPAD